MNEHVVAVARVAVRTGVAPESLFAAGTYHPDDVLEAMMDALREADREAGG